MPSLEHKSIHSATAHHEPPACSGTTKNINGDTKIRPTVTALAQVAMALGSTGTRQACHIESLTSELFIWSAIQTAATKSGPVASVMVTS